MKTFPHQTFNGTKKLEMEITPRFFNKNTSNGSDFYIGLCLSLISSLFIGSSFIMKKTSLIRISRGGYLRAGAGGYGYLKDWMWWLGLLTMGVGELLNFTAYAFAPASLVTPLGALSVLVSALLASKFLNEKITNIGAVGCLLCLLGSTMIVIHSPKEEHIHTLSKLVDAAKNPAFINYIILVIVVCLIILCYIGPRYGTRYVTVYLILCSAIGSITVMASKGLGLAIKSIAGEPLQSLSNMSIPFFLSVTMLICICVQMIYLNKALDLFSTSVVTPIYYVMFTTLVIVASSILFQEWKSMNELNIVGATCGFFVTIVAIFLLNSFKDGNSANNNLIRQSYKQYGTNADFPVRFVLKSIEAQSKELLTQLIPGAKI